MTLQQLNADLAVKLEAIEQQRYLSKLSTENKIREIGYSLLSNTEEYAQKQLDAEKELALAKEALRKGDLEKAKAHKKAYEKLVTDSAGREVKEGKVVTKSKEETAKAAIAGLKEVQALEEALFNAKIKNLETENKKAVGVKDAELKKIAESKALLSKPTNSVHTIKDNTKEVAKKIDVLKKPTQSTHTVNIKYNDSGKPYADGGLVKQHLANGGTFTGSGRVPGNDPYDSDSVNARLTAGEFVLKRASVDILGSDVLNRLNNSPRSLTSSGAGVASASQTPLQQVNLTIGQTTYKMMTDVEVAQALQRNLETQGGL